MTFYSVLQSAAHLGQQYLPSLPLPAALDAFMIIDSHHWFPKEILFSLSQPGIPAAASICHSVLRFIAILGILLPYTCSQTSFISFSGVSRMEEVAINRREEAMPEDFVMSELIVCKFWSPALILATSSLPRG